MAGSPAQIAPGFLLEKDILRERHAETFFGKAR